ncbi:glucose-6-phosphate isomerase [Marilutibacter chinensis]|uniref:Glucose-6-phosphate isomerase n=1 Tax=Marilutibacter chinensis TaxID=2912247 RepID=A0ABS9HQK3_9GAMM|nr:glucose-6-phosphate isomerase [Lysobacter chinensis]MCF7220913.1 glucose-6-phosphate isomerase [Lysobacter chinensis]
MSATDRIDTALQPHVARLKERRTSDLIQADPGRARELALRVGPVYANFARQGYDRDALGALFGLLRDVDAEDRIRAQFDGEKINLTEDRAVLHTALRSDLSDAPAARAAHAQALQARTQMRQLVAALEADAVTDVVSVGIGGSDLGPRLAVDALADPAGRGLRVHFLSNVDGHAAQRVLAGLDPARTAGILISKTFGTQETLLNGQVLGEWLGAGAAQRLYAVSANVKRPAEVFGIPAGRILPMWDWVGGRYSLWSAVGFPIALAIGMDAFEDFLAGAAEMDAHVLRSPLERNLAAWHAATGLWNRNALGHATHAVLPYDDRLKLLSNYLQQLVMESLGKSVRRDGSPVAGNTVPVWWGGVGTDTQHSFFQALHQGTSIVPADFIGVVRADAPYTDNHRALHANLLAQTEAFANGQASDDPHRNYAGGRPTTTILLDALTPRALGALLALYEHSVYLQSVAWGINAFDQFGVELGKQVASRLLPALDGEAEADDPVTRVLLEELRRR